ncbi:Cytochrome P450 [Sergentomyia squamirostris]
MALFFESFSNDLVAFLAFCAVGLYLYIQHIYSYWAKRNVKYAKPIFPFGNLKDSMLLKTSVQEVFNEIYRSTDEKILGIYTADKPALLVRDPGLLRLILIKDFQHFHDRGVYSNESIDPLSGHLFSINGEKWKNLRSKLTPTFTSGKLKAMFSTFLDCGKSLEEFITKHEDQEIETRDLMARYATNIIASVAFGLDTDTIINPQDKFRALGRKFFDPTLKTIVRLACLTLLPHLGKLFRIKSVENDYEQFIFSIVRETMVFREKNNVQRKDFMQLLLQLKNTGKVDSDDNWNIQATGNNVNTLTFGELAAQAHVFFVAGFETSAASISFCLYELAKNPTIQAKVQAEIDELIKKHNGEITYELVMETKYLECCVDEILRLYPAIPVLNRQCTIEYQLPGTNLTLEKGTRILIPVHAIHYDPKYYPDPKEFRPERFLQGNPNSGDKGIIYMPFGEGPRTCIAMRMGKLEAKIGLILILSKFNIRLGERLEKIKEVIFDKKCLTPTLAGGTHLKFSTRN